MACITLPAEIPMYFTKTVSSCPSYILKISLRSRLFCSPWKIVVSLKKLWIGHGPITQLPQANRKTEAGDLLNSGVLSYHHYLSWSGVCTKSGINMVTPGNRGHVYGGVKKILLRNRIDNLPCPSQWNLYKLPLYLQAGQGRTTQNLFYLIFKLKKLKNLNWKKLKKKDKSEIAELNRLHFPRVTLFILWRASWSY